MKILIIRNIPSYMDVRGGTYNIQEVGQAKALVRKGHECGVLLWTSSSEETLALPAGNGREVRVFYRRGLSVAKNAVFFGCGALFSEYDVLQPCEYNQLEAWLLARTQPGKTVIRHGPYAARFNWRYRLMCRVFDAFFLGTYIRQGTRFLTKSASAKAFLAAKGIPEERICTIGVGLDAQMLRGGDGGALARRMQADAGKLRMLYVGRLERRRNIRFLFEILERVLRRNPDARLYVVGTGEAGYVEAVFRHAQALGIRDRIVWQARMEQKDLGMVYPLADFFLLPTAYEIFGMAMLEAMFFRTVVLTTKNGGSGMLIRDGVNGWILDGADAGAWAERILDTYADPQTLRRMQAAAARTVSERFTWDALAEDFLAQYALAGAQGGEEASCRRGA